MNILFFGTYYHPYVSGITTYPRTLLQHLRKRHHITILTFAFKHDLPREDLSADNIVRMPFMARLSKGFISPQSILQFLRAAKTAQLVILNIPNFEGLPLALIARMRGIPIVSIYHCRVFLGRTLSERIVNTALNFSIKLQLLLSNRIVVYTLDYVNSLEHPTLSKTKYVPILPPVPVLPVNRDFLRRLNERKNSSRWVGFAGRIASEKGIENIILAIARLKPTIDGLELVIAGPGRGEVAGEGRYAEAIERTASNYDVTMTTLGTLEGGQLGAFYQAIDVLVLPSVNQTEAFGLVQAEAMLAGTPVIASNLPGVRFPIQSTGMGLLVKPNDPESLSTAVEEVCLKPDRFATRANRTKARSLFELSQTLQAYDQLVSEYR